MHTLTFTFKRAHWRGVALGVEAVAAVPDMTPARFDLLYVIRKRFPTTRIIDDGEDERPPAWQTFANALQMNVRRVLGVSRSTVSRMLKRLTELGWVRCTPSIKDARTNIIHLTPLGRRRIDDAIRIVYRQRTHLSKFEGIFGPSTPEDHVLDKIDTYWRTTRAIADKLGDRSTLSYDFGLRNDWGKHEKDEHEFTPLQVRDDPFIYQRANFEKRVRSYVGLMIGIVRRRLHDFVVVMPELDLHRPFGPTGDATPMPLP